MGGAEPADAGHDAKTHPAKRPDGGDAGASDGGPDDDAGDAGDLSDAEAPDAEAPDGGGAEDGGGVVTCSLGCHGSEASAAPPKGLFDEMSTTESAVGAHQQHLATGTWHRTVQCNDCHKIPTKPKKDPLVPTHLNGKRDLDWSNVAKQGSYDAEAETCSDTHCHGGDLQTDLPGKETNRSPIWTKVDGSQAVCGTSCHSLPPGGDHPQVSACQSCHADVIKKLEPGDPPKALWADASLHIDGKIEFYNGYTCTSCHGDDNTGNPAPPRGTKNEMATTEPAVGAHASHLAKSQWHRDVKCTDCHPKPYAMPHDDGKVDFEWGGPAAAHGAQPGFDLKAVNCSGVYCHGATLAGGSLTTPQWTTVDGSQAECGTCHGLPPSGKHPKSNQCNVCHTAVIESCPPNDPAKCQFQPDISADKSFRLHINGKVDVAISGSCDGCHGAPPANGTHLIHAAGADLPDTYGSLEPRANATSYAYNCGYCHPLDEAKHADGNVDVELYDANAPVAPVDPLAEGDRRSVKHANPAAKYLPGPNSYQGDIASYTDGSCANVYCHSAEVPLAPTVPDPTAQASPAWFVWQSVTPFYDETKNVCCVNTPDDYPDFTVTVTRKYETPTWVGQAYSGPSKCAHCHDYPPRSEPPSNVGAGQGHAWIDPSGWEDGHFWNMSQGWPIQCRRCHADTVAADLTPAQWHYAVDGSDKIVFDAEMVIAGFTKHVNGRKDVAFAYSGDGCDKAHPDLGYDSVPCLKQATFDPATRSCANVECHLQQKQVTWGAPYRADWGAVECDNCHQLF